MIVMERDCIDLKEMLIMGRRLALYSDILEKMSLGMGEYITYYSSKLEKYKSLSELKSRYENAKNGYEASLMISYDCDSKNFHEKNISKIKTELTVLKNNLYPVVYSNNKIKSTFQRLFYVPFSRRNKIATNRIMELEERLQKSTEAYEFYKNKYELGCNYLEVLGFTKANKTSSEKIKNNLDNVILEFNDFISKNMKSFEEMKTQEEFYRLTKTDIEDKIVSFTKKTSELETLKKEFEEKKVSLENVTEAKKLLNEVNHKITAVID